MYEVGQVLFLVLKSKQKIVPVKIMEQIVRKSIEAEKVQYLVKVPGKDELINLDSLLAEVYTHIGDVKNELYQNISSVIDTMAERAIAMASNEFGFVENQRISVARPQTMDDESIKVEFPDGLVGNVILPDEYASVSSKDAP